MDDLIVSYQMGKVGSSALVEAIPNCLQFHSWSGEEPVKFFSSRNTASLKGKFSQYLRWRWRYFQLDRKKTKTIKSGGRIKLLIGIREPIGRNVSGFFQSLMSRESGVTLEECINNFYMFCPHLAPIYWFDAELKNKLGIDVYKYPFDKESGYCTFSEGIYDLFVYRMENLNELTVTISGFLDLPELKLKSINEAGDKWLAPLYVEFKKEIEISDEYFNLLTRNGYFEHFYGDDYLEELKSKWISK
jgi:hypothetical protein